MFSLTRLVTILMIRVLSGLDIGGSKVACLVGEANKERMKVVLKSADLRESKGIENGVIVNAKEFSKTVEKTISGAEKIYGQNIKSVFVNLSGENVQSSLISLEKQLLVSDAGITPFDIYKVSNEIVNRFENDGKEVIQTVLISSNKNDVLNGENDSKEKKIKYTFNVVYTDKAKTDKIRNVLRKLNINIENFVCNSYASSLCVSEHEVVARITLLIDIGYEFTDFCVLQNGKCIFCDCIKMAGKVLTQDIAAILRIPFNLAEEIKIKNTTLLLDPFEERENIKVNIDGGEDSFRVAKEKRKLINDIFFARMEEIIKEIRKVLEKKKLFDKIENVVITGGTANVFGLEKFVEDTIERKTKKLLMSNLEVSNTISEEKIKNPAYSTAIGLLLFASKIYQQEISMNKSSSRSRLGSFVNKLLQSLINLFIS